jgi:hypothetical protein
MTRQGLQWFDAVVITYRWTDSYDLAQVAYDIAGPTTSKNVFTETRERPYPGPGPAAGILNRAQGRGRQLEVTAVNNYNAKPGQPTTVNIPGTEAQTGYTAAVTWDVESAEMAVTTRGLVDTPANAYLFGPVGYSYLDVPAGISYNEYDWSMA